MAKLIIHRGDVIDREIELDARNCRIGRGDDNEIVLTDPTKSVSRLHAELRFDQGKYSVVDLNSQNGVWVAGRRVPTIDLEPGVAVVLGSYKLVLKDERPPGPAFNEAAQFLAPTSATTVLISGPTTARPAAKVEVPGPPPNVVAPASVSQVELEPKPMPPVVVDAAKEVSKPEVPAPTPAPPAPPSPPAEAARVAKPAPPSPPPLAPAPAPAARAAAPTKQSGRRVPRSLLLAAPALLLVGGAAGVLFLTSLGAQLMGRKPAETTTAAPPPLMDPPAVPPPPVAQPTPAVQTPLPDPVDKAPIPDLTGIFEEARAAMIRGDHLAAIAGFKSVLKIDPNYPSAQNLLGVAQGRAKDASQLAVDSGNKAEMNRDYPNAMKQYDRALLLDPESTSVPDAIRGLKARMQSEGEETFQLAQQYDASARIPDAISEYEKVLLLLPASHASAKIARERLAVLKREV